MITSEGAAVRDGSFLGEGAGVWGDVYLTSVAGPSVPSALDGRRRKRDNKERAVAGRRRLSAGGLATVAFEYAASRICRRRPPLAPVAPTLRRS